MSQAALMWFRRDLRPDDNAALYHALKNHTRVYTVFVFDTTILQHLPRQDRRVVFIWHSLVALNAALQAQGGALIVLHGEPTTLIPQLAQQLGVGAVYTNHDDEPDAITRDNQVKTALAQQGCGFQTYKDQWVFTGDEVLTGAGKPYTVFTPYKNNWLKTITPFYLKPYPVAKYAAHLAKRDVATPWPSLAQMGFDENHTMPAHIKTGYDGATQLLSEFIERMARYQDTRDFPATKGPSYLSVHLRFGTLSIRTAARAAMNALQMNPQNAGAATWLSELIWRDFYAQILQHFPHVARGSFKPEYDRIQWLGGAQAAQHFEAWKTAQTGYPLVDAAMVQLNQTGYMHNRLRMVSACFLIKDLGIDWRWGEQYFAQQLNDFDLSANNGGWQWAASSGCDAQPYFRIFNPITQSEKFDSQGAFIRRYLPQLAQLPDKYIHAPWTAPPLVLQQSGVKLGETYPLPIVDHTQARQETLARYAVVKTAAVY